MLTVPLNYQNPSGSAIQLAVSRVRPASADAKYQGVMLANPGGSGLQLSTLDQFVPGGVGATPYEGSLEVRLFPNSSLIAEPGGTTHADSVARPGAGPLGVRSGIDGCSCREPAEHARKTAIQVTDFRRDALAFPRCV